MGVSIYLHIDFQDVSQARWESVYEETLELVNAYPFMDRVVDKAAYRETFSYVDRTRERYLSPGYQDKLGWYTIGDMVTFDHAESFMLFRDVDFWKEQIKDCGTGEVYFSLICEDTELHPEIQETTPCALQVFDSKTQGHDYHKYLLAVCCLIEDRLKPHVLIDGDITLAQIKDSVEWANQHLKKAIVLPDRCDYRALTSRIRAQLKSEVAQIEALFLLLLYPEERELGDFIRETFHHQAIRDYWKKHLKEYEPDTYGLNAVLCRYLDMNFSLEDLCDILVLEDQECFMDSPTFMSAILSTGILKHDRHDGGSIFRNQDNPDPETIPSLLLKSFLVMAGSTVTTRAYYDERELRDLFYEKFGRTDAVDTAFAEYSASSEEDTLSRVIQELIEEAGGESARAESFDAESIEEIMDRYDISFVADIIHWTKGATVAPSVQSSIQELREFSDGLLEKLHREFAETAREERIETLLENNRFFFIRKEMWDYLFEMIEDDTVYCRFLSLLRVRADEVSVNALLKGTCNNLAFLKYFFLTEATP